MLRRPWITLHRIEVWPQRNSAKSSCFLLRLVDYYLWGGRGRTQVNESTLNPEKRHGSTVNYIIGFLSPPIQPIRINFIYVRPYFLVPSSFCFKPRVSGKLLIWKLIFIFMQIKTYFNKKHFALGLISKVIVFGLWNWPIQLWLERSCAMRAFRHWTTRTMTNSTARTLVVEFGGKL